MIEKKIRSKLGTLNLEYNLSYPSIKHLADKILVLLLSEINKDDMWQVYGYLLLDC